MMTTTMVVVTTTTSTTSLLQRSNFELRNAGTHNGGTIFPAAMFGKPSPRMPSKLPVKKVTPGSETASRNTWFLMLYPATLTVSWLAKPTMEPLP